MQALLSHGWLILLPVFLIILIFRKTAKVTVKNVPSSFQNAIQQAFNQTKYNHLMNYWLAVSKMETGGFTSSLFLRFNNPWGMKFPRQRVNTVSGQTGEGWATYSHIDNAARDIILWMDAKRFRTDVKSLEAFVTEMKANGYFEEPYAEYLKLVKAWITR